MTLIVDEAEQSLGMEDALLACPRDQKIHCDGDEQDSWPVIWGKKQSYLWPNNSSVFSNQSNCKLRLGRQFAFGFVGEAKRVKPTFVIVVLRVSLGKGTYTCLLSGQMFRSYIELHQGGLLFRWKTVLHIIYANQLLVSNRLQNGLWTWYSIAWKCLSTMQITPCFSIGRLIG